MYLRWEERLARDDRYRLRLWRCYILSCSVFAAAAFTVPPSCVPPAFQSEKLAKIGEAKIAEYLATTEFPTAEQEAFISRRIAEGALIYIEITVEDEVEEGPAEGGRPIVRIGEITPIQPPKITEEIPETPPPTIEVEFELSHDFSMVNRSRESSQTSEFGILELYRPDYPATSIFHNIEGTIVLRVLVNPSGLVKGIDTLENETDVHCETAAREAIKEWIFKPIYRDGQPIWFRVLVPIQFELDET
jgi:TonB family protein